MDMSVRLAHSYFDMLKSLGDETKLHLIKMLTDSLLKKKGQVIPPRVRRWNPYLVCGQMMPRQRKCWKLLKKSEAARRAILCHWTNERIFT